MSEKTETIELINTPVMDTFVVGTGTPDTYLESDSDIEINTINDLLEEEKEPSEATFAKKSEIYLANEPVPELTEAQKEFQREACSLLSTTDPETGLEYEWLEIRKRLCNGEKPVDVLPAIFDYYEEKNPKMDAWLNYQLACSHFEKDELGPKNRFERKQLEARVKKLMKKSKKPGQSMNMRQFLYDNKDISI